MKAAIQKKHTERVESGKPPECEAADRSEADDAAGLEAEADKPKLEGDVREPTDNVGEEGNEEGEEECPDEDEEVAVEDRDEKDVD